MDQAVLVDVTTAFSKEIPLTSDKFLIGRGLHNTHVITHTDVSRTHCILERSQDEWSVLDKSTNGTVLNGQLIDKSRSYKLVTGDIISFGEVKLVFKMPLSNNNIGTSITGDKLALSEAEEVFNIAAAVVDDVQAFQSEIESSRLNQNDFSSTSVEPATNNQNSGCSSAPTDTTEQQQPQTSKDSQPSLNAAATCLEFADDELQCSICTELFIQAVTLSCSHSFCTYCITSWRKKSSFCPICRAKITTQCQTRVLDTFIDKLQNSNEELKKHRLEVIAQREAEVGPPAQSSSTASTSAVNPRRRPAPGPIEISSEEDVSDEELDEDVSDYSGSDWERDYDYDEWYDYNGVPGQYYGGYGHCYVCGERGHWANGCPNK